MVENEPITEWLTGLQQKEDVAAQQLWDHYCRQLIQIARGRLGNLPRHVYDEEDAALSAFASFCRGVELDRFPKLNDRENLWQLLVTITARKVIARHRYENREKRAGTITTEQIGEIVGREPSPEFAAEVAEQCESLVEKLSDTRLREIAILKIEGFTVEEIAQRIGCSRRSIIRKLNRIRAHWSLGMDAEDPTSGCLSEDLNKT